MINFIRGDVIMTDKTLINVSYKIMKSNRYVLNKIRLKMVGVT